MLNALVNCANEPVVLNCPQRILLREVEDGDKRVDQRCAPDFGLEIHRRSAKSRGKITPTLLLLVEIKPAVPRTDIYDAKSQAKARQQIHNMMPQVKDQARFAMDHYDCPTVQVLAAVGVWFEFFEFVRNNMSPPKPKKPKAGKGKNRATDAPAARIPPETPTPLLAPRATHTAVAGPSTASAPTAPASPSSDDNWSTSDIGTMVLLAKNAVPPPVTPSRVGDDPENLFALPRRLAPTTPGANQAEPLEPLEPVAELRTIPNVQSHFGCLMNEANDDLSQLFKNVIKYVFETHFRDGLGALQGDWFVPDPEGETEWKAPQRDAV